MKKFIYIGLILKCHGGIKRFIYNMSFFCFFLNLIGKRNVLLKETPYSTTKVKNQKRNKLLYRL